MANIINLATETKQDEILSAVSEEINYSNIITKEVQARASMDVVLEISGSGKLHFLSCYYNSSTTYPFALRITLDGNVFLDKSAVGPASTQSALIGTEANTEIYTTSNTYSSSLYTNNSFFDKQLTISGNCWRRRYKNPLIFEKSLKIEVYMLTTNIAYELT